MVKWIIDRNYRIPAEIDQANAGAVLEQVCRSLSLPCDALTALRSGSFLRSDGQPIGSAHASPEELAVCLTSECRSDTVYLRGREPGTGVRAVQIRDDRFRVTGNNLTLAEMARRLPFEGPRRSLAFSRLWHSLSTALRGRGVAAVQCYPGRKLFYEVRQDTFLRMMNYAPPMGSAVKSWKESILASLYLNKVSDFLFIDPSLQAGVQQFCASNDLSDLITTPEASRFLDAYCRIQAAEVTGEAVVSLSGQSFADRNPDELIPIKLQQIQSLPSHSRDLAFAARAGADLLRIMEARFDPDVLPERQDRAVCESTIRRLFATDSCVQNYLITKLFGGTPAERSAVQSMNEAELLLFCRLHRGSLQTVSLPQAVQKYREAIAAEQAAPRPGAAIRSAQFFAKRKIL